MYVKIFQNNLQIIIHNNNANRMNKKIENLLDKFI